MSKSSIKKSLPLPRVAARRLANMFSQTRPTPVDLVSRLNYESFAQYEFNAKVRNRRQRAADRRIARG